jgi:predicted nucleotidyltransferase
MATDDAAHARSARCTETIPERRLLPGVRWRKLAGMELGRAVALLRESLPGLIAVYEFGSTAAGVSRPGSDVDLAVLCDSPLRAEDRWALQEKVAAALGRDVDLVDLRRASTVMRMQVVSTGRVRFDGDPSARESFEDVVFSAYARLNEERAAILRDVAASGRVHG